MEQVLERLRRITMSDVKESNDVTWGSQKWLYECWDLSFLAVRFTIGEPAFQIGASFSVHPWKFGLGIWLIKPLGALTIDVAWFQVHIGWYLVERWLRMRRGETAVQEEEG